MPLAAWHRCWAAGDLAFTGSAVVRCRKGDPPEVLRMSAPSTPTTAWQWPADVVNFAVQHQVDAYLDPVMAAIQRTFPTATSVRAFVEDDPELRDVWYIVLEVRVPAADVPDYVAAKRPWYRELSQIWPKPSATMCPFTLCLLTTTS
jgi:hypothetical protein